MKTQLWKMLVLRAPEGDGGSGAGGAGDAPKPLTADDVKKLIGEELTKTVNSAVTSQLKRLDIGKVVADAVAKAIPPKDDDDPGDAGDVGQAAAGAAKGGAPGGAAKLDPVVERQMKELQKQNATIQKQLDDWKAKAEAEATKVRGQEDRSLVTDLLTGAKIRAKAMPIAITHLLGTRITREVDDKGVFGPPMWKNDDGSLVEPKEGFAAYMKSEEGLELLPPVDGGGSGGGGGKRAGGGQSGGVTDAQLMNHILGTSG